MPELYEPEIFIHNRVPVRVLCHSLDGEAIYTPLHWHRNVEFSLTEAGRIVVNIDGTSRVQASGEWTVANSGELHSNSWVSLKDHYEGVSVQFSRTFLDTWLGSETMIAYPEDPETLAAVRDMLGEFGAAHRDPGCNDLARMELVFRFLSFLQAQGLVREKPAGGRRSKAVHNIKDIVNYIDEHYREEMDLTQAASTFHYTPEHLSRIFKEHIGITYYQYLQSVRLMHCVEVMKEQPDVRLIDCAMDNGFPNVKSFIQTFKKTFDCTPTEWLKARNVNN